MHGSPQKKKVHVGFIMPIAPIDGCGSDHWLEVKSIMSEALANNHEYEFETRIVSESDSIGLIHKRIVQGIYNSDIVICDVSCKNPNVMFELGMRLAFDKPTVIIKDDKTSYSFDTSGIEHLEYPRDLRFAKIVEFKSLLERKVVGTLEDSLKDPEHSPFLKSFGEFKVAKLHETEVTPIDLIFDRLAEIQSDLSRIKQSNNQAPVLKKPPRPRSIDPIKESANRYLETIDQSAGGVDLNDMIRFVASDVVRYGAAPFPTSVIKEVLEYYLESKNFKTY